MTVEIRERLKQARLAAKLSQIEVASELGLSHQTVSKWERGGSLPGAIELSRMCALYGTSADYVLYGITAMPAVLHRIMEFNPSGPACPPACEACDIRARLCES